MLFLLGCVVVLSMTLPGVHSQIMATRTLAGEGTITVLGGDGTAEAVVTLSAEQIRLNERCLSRCKTELCYLADPDDCRRFIMCEQGARGLYTATTQRCAFGTFWGGFQRQQKVTCDLPSNVNCNIDYCQGRSIGDRFDHVDGNCKTYWECGEKGPMPKCCDVGFRYDRVTKTCVADTLGECQDVCPIKFDACLALGQLTDFFDDGNCRTYWDCEDKRPHPVCCPEGQGYVRNQGCVAMPSCTDACPRQYEPDVCLSSDTYPLLDGYCRTFMRCNSLDGDERWCCPSNHVFDEQTLSCVVRTLDMDLNCIDTCPSTYQEVCHLRPAADASSYIVELHNGEIVRPCAPGTMFDVAKCGCAVKVKNAPDNSCTMELDVEFNAPNWTRSGSQKATEISQSGTIFEGPKLNGKSSYRFDGGLYFRTPFFRSDYENIYINVIYQTDATARGKQILLSNCMTRDLQGASLELSLENGQISLSLLTDDLLFNQTGPVIASVPYTPNVWNKFTAIYDGQNVYILNEGAEAPAFDRQSLTGVVVVAAEGLDIGGCRINRERNSGFVGAVSKLQFSKCLKQEWIDAFNAAVSPTA